MAAYKDSTYLFGRTGISLADYLGAFCYRRTSKQLVYRRSHLNNVVTASAVACPTRYPLTPPISPPASSPVSPRRDLSPFPPSPTAMSGDLHGSPTSLSSPTTSPLPPIEPLLLTTPSAPGTPVNPFWEAIDGATRLQQIGLLVYVTGSPDARINKCYGMLVSWAGLEGEAGVEISLRACSGTVWKDNMTKYSGAVRISLAHLRIPSLEDGMEVIRVNGEGNRAFVRQPRDDLCKILVQNKKNAKAVQRSAKSKWIGKHMVDFEQDWLPVCTKVSARRFN